MTTTTVLACLIARNWRDGADRGPLLEALLDALYAVRRARWGEVWD